MNNARSSILEKIRQANQRQVTTSANPDTWKQHMQRHQRSPLPQWSDDHESRFIAQLEKAGGTVKHVRHKNELMPEVVSYLNQHTLPTRLLSASTPLLNGLVWPDTIDIEQRDAKPNDETVITEAYAAVAETGSLVLCSSYETPTALNFLPDNFLCVVHKNRLVAHTEDIWDLIRQEKSEMPRAIHFITGPSRTADVEQTIQIGAHGPRRLHVLLLA